MKIDHLLVKLDELRSKGYGRRRIAAALGISEWEARRLLAKSKYAKPLQPNKTTTVLAAGDAHIPFEDKIAVKIFRSFLKATQPDILVLLGDLIDFYAISRFIKDPGRKLELQDDIDKTAEFLRDVRSLAPNTEIVYIEGNHSHRLTSYLWRTAPELYSLKVLSLPLIFDLEALEISMVPYGNEYEVGPVTFMHGDVARKKSGSTAHALLDKYRTNVITGHIHRLGGIFRTWHDTVYTGIEAGCLCSTDMDYVTKPDWQHGFVSVHIADGDEWSFELHKIHNGRLVTSHGIYT